MTLNSDGFCSKCQKWALDFPGLECPHCHDASADAARKHLHLDPNVSPVEVLTAIREELAQIRRRQRQIFALRSVAARALLRRGNVAEDVKAARTKLWAVERWAVADQPKETRERLAPRQMKSPKGLRIEYEERMERRQEIFELTVEDSIPERLRPSLGTREAVALLAQRSPRDE